MINKLLKEQTKLIILTIIFIISLFMNFTILVMISMCGVVYYCIKCIHISIKIDKRYLIEINRIKREYSYIKIQI